MGSWSNVFEYSIFGADISKLIYPTIIMIIVVEYPSQSHWAMNKLLTGRPTCETHFDFYSVKIQARVFSIDLYWTVVKWCPVISDLDYFGLVISDDNR